MNDPVYSIFTLPFIKLYRVRKTIEKGEIAQRGNLRFTKCLCLYPSIPDFNPFPTYAKYAADDLKNIGQNKETLFK